MKTINGFLESRSLRQLLAGMVLAAGIFMMGCAEPAPTTPGVTGANTALPPTAAVITVCSQTPNGCSQDTSFSLATLRDLSISVDWTNVAPGTQTQTLQLLDPGGGSYQITNSSFVVADHGNGVGQASTNVLIPVSGSMISQRQITGAWKIEVNLNGMPVASQNVILQP